MVSDRGVCVLGVSVRGYMSGGVLSCHHNIHIVRRPSLAFDRKHNFCALIQELIPEFSYPTVALKMAHLVNEA